MKVKSMLVIALLTIAVGSPAFGGGGNGGNKMLYPPQSHALGKTYGEWSAAWWQWAYSLPVDQNPFFDVAGYENGANGQSGPVWFLTGVINVSGTADRTLNIPSGKSLFFPILNVECATLEGNGTTLEELLSCTKSYMDVVVPGSVFCEIDGVPVQNMENYRAQSGLFTYGPLADNNVLQFFGYTAPAGATSLSFSDGYYMMLKPLSPGKHTLHYGGTFGAPFAFSLDITYHLTVFGAPDIVPPTSLFQDQTLAQWLSTYWRWYGTGADMAQSMVNGVQLMPLPAGEAISGAGSPDDPVLLRGKLEFTLPAGTPFVLPAYSMNGERYEGYPTTPDDLPFADDFLLGGVHPFFTIDGTPIITDANKAAYYVPATSFDPIIMYSQPTSYGSVATVFFQGDGFICSGLKPGVHIIRLYEPYIIPGYWGVIYDNTWIITVE